MKKIITLLVLFICTGTSTYAQIHISTPKTYLRDPNSSAPIRHNPSGSRGVACDTILLDYNEYNEVTAANHTPLPLTFNGSWLTGSMVYGQEITPFADANHAFDYTYAMTRFDSIAYGNITNFTTSFYNRATSTISLDSLGMFIGIWGDTVQANNVMVNDSLVFKIYSITGTTVSTNPVKTIVFRGYNQLRPFFRGAGYIGYTQIGINQQFTLGQSFAIRMDYLGKDTSSHCSLSYTFADSCGSIVYMGNTYASPAYPSPFVGNALWAQIGANGTVTPQNSGFGFNLSGIDINCTYVYTQNWEFIPIVSVCQNTGVNPPTVVTTAATNIAQTTATLNGTVNANGNTAAVSFEWGLTTSYGNTATATPANVSGSVVTPVSANLTGLTANTTYHFRVKATNTGGPSNGNDLTFTTLVGGGVCTPDPGVTSGMSPTSSNIPCITQGQSFSQTFTFVVPASAGGVTINSVHFDSIGNLPAGLIYAFNQSPATYNGGASGCFIISGSTNAPCGQYQMPIYVTINTAIGSFPGELSAIAAQFGIAGFEMRFLRVIAPAGSCPAVNASQSVPFVAGPCGSSVLTVTITKMDVSCFNQSTGSATANPSGGTGPYTYAWSNNGTTATITNLAAGAYTVTVTDNATATATASVTITQPASALSVTTSSIQAACGQNNGSATANPAGGTATYTFLWSNSGNTGTISNVGAGTYSVTVTDSKGCTATASVTVSTPATFTLSVSTTNVTCYGQSTGTATATASGGSGFTYVWSNSGNTATISNLPAGSYSVTVTDANSCVKTASGTVTQPANPLTASASSTPSSCGSSTGTATVTVTNNVGSPTYAWSPGGGTTQTISNLSAGTYSVTVTAGGCTATASVSVNNSNGPSVTIQKVDPTCFGSTNGSATALVSGGTPGYTYLWSNNATGSSVNGLAAGTYTLIVTDNGGCSAFGSVTLVQPNPITLTETITNVNCNGAQTGGVSLVVGGGTGPYIYGWSNSSSSSAISNLAAGNYSVTVTDSKSCTAASTYTVTQPAALTLTTSSTPSTGTNGTTTANVSGGSSPYNYTWSGTPTQTTATATALASGSYSVTVTDSKGCSATASVAVVFVGIEETSIITGFSLFPNPANDKVNVVIDLGGTHAVQLNVTDVNGRVMYTRKEMVNSKLNHAINLNEFTAGVYIIEAIDDKQTIRKRFMVIR